MEVFRWGGRWGVVEVGGGVGRWGSEDAEERDERRGRWRCLGGGAGGGLWRLGFW